MKTVDFEVILGSGGFSRVRFETQAGRILGFVIQLECLIDDEWHRVIRYDTAHGYAHCEALHPRKVPQKIDLNITDYNSALTCAQRDVAERWHDHCERFEKWLDESQD